MKSFLATYVREQGKAFFKDVDVNRSITAVEAVMKLITLKQIIERYVTVSCGGNETLRQAERDGFEIFLN